MKKIFLGPPGSGKGTAASRIAPKFKILHISTGDLFREHITNKTKIGIKANEFIKNGNLVPDDLTIEILKQRIAQEDCKNGFILDGFPRTMAQAEMLHELTEIDVVINMDVPEEIIIERLSSRISCLDCKKIYNLKFATPKIENLCDDCQGQVIRRPDDEPDIIKDRLKVYKEQTEPLVDFYKNKGILIDVICKEINQTPEQTFQKTLDAINEFLGKRL